MLPGFVKLHLFLRVGVTAVVLGGVSASASILLDTGVLTFAATGNQFGRISRNGVSSVWGDVKAFPGITGAPTARKYETIDIADTGDRQFLQISMDDPTASFFFAAYLNSFNPVNSGPNFGLDVNYLGDPGGTEPFDNPGFFQIFVAPHSHLVIPINEINPGGGTGQEFELLVEGFYDSSYSEVAPVAPVPEPTSVLLYGTCVLALFLLRPFAFGRNRNGIR